MYQRGLGLVSFGKIFFTKYFYESVYNFWLGWFSRAMREGKCHQKLSQSPVILVAGH